MKKIIEKIETLGFGTIIKIHFFEDVLPKFDKLNPNINNSYFQIEFENRTVTVKFNYPLSNEALNHLYDTVTAVFNILRCSVKIGESKNLDLVYPYFLTEVQEDFSNRNIEYNEDILWALKVKANIAFDNDSLMQNLVFYLSSFIWEYAIMSNPKAKLFALKGDQLHLRDFHFMEIKADLINFVNLIPKRISNPEEVDND